jgi:hypothetical protein
LHRLAPGSRKYQRALESGHALLSYDTCGRTRLRVIEGARSRHLRLRGVSRAGMVVSLPHSLQFQSQKGHWSLLQPNAIERQRTALRNSRPSVPAPGEIIVTYAFPALLVGLTALITSSLVHAGYGLWWLSHHLFRGDAASYDWAGAFAVSGTATTIVLIAGLMVRRLVAGNTPPASTGEAAQTRDPGRAGPHRNAPQSLKAVGET